jgi:hypothetical protein
MPITGDRASWLVVAAGTPIPDGQYRCAIVGADAAVGAAGRTNMAHERAAKAGRCGYCCTLPADAAPGRYTRKSNSFNDPPTAESRSSSRIYAPREVIACELLAGRDWTTVISPDGVAVQVARVRGVRS